MYQNDIINIILASFLSILEILGYKTSLCFCILCSGATKFKEETEKSFTTCLRIIKPQPFQPPEKSIKNDDSFEFMKTPYRLSRRTRETHDSKPTYEGSNNKKEKQHRYRVKTSESKLIETTIEGVVELNSEQ